MFKLKLAVAVGALVAASTAAGGASAQEAMTIQEAVTRAVSHHPDVDRARASHEVDAQSIEVEKAGHLPSVDLEGEAGYQNFTSETDHRLRGGITFKITQPIFDGNFASRQVSGAEFTAEASKERLRETRENKALEAAEAYLEVYRTREARDIASRNLDRHTELTDLVVVRAEQGGGTEADVLQAQVRTDAAKVRLNEAQDAVATAEATFLQLVGTQAGEVTFQPFGGMVTPKSNTEALEEARAKNPALSAVAATELAAKENIEANTANFYPLVDLELSQSLYENFREGSGDSRETRAMVVFTWNLYAGGSDEAKRRRAVALLGESVAGKASLDRQLEQQVSEDMSFLETMEQNVPILQERMTKSEEVLVQYNQQFQVGARTLLDLLNAENELFQARTDLLDARVQYEFAKYRVYNTLGSLLNVFEVASTEGK
ncbi:TolC family outer membrane protein [Magnetospira sp. QH-2]|uniref:TolC family outer membrane protein n=1 Tax=Magnetospira sp. (strain QH-2) TaxID=1288970 RepID=UPI0003E80CD3|nr:TolC family outer membrane protein [Magnetospira sp. QH-2]CCQ75231.1 conserved outer membrane protein of unknown function [Magnetospira sp. QH-2]